MSYQQAKRISSSFNEQQSVYLERLAKIEGMKLTTYVTNLVLQDIREAIKSGKLPVNLPSLERRQIIMTKFIRYVFLMNLQLDPSIKDDAGTDNVLTEADLLTTEELQYVAASIDVDYSLFKRAFFEQELSE